MTTRKERRKLQRLLVGKKKNSSFDFKTWINEIRSNIIIAKEKNEIHGK